MSPYYARSKAYGVSIYKQDWAKHMRNLQDRPISVLWKIVCKFACQWCYIKNGVLVHPTVLTPLPWNCCLHWQSELYISILKGPLFSLHQLSWDQLFSGILINLILHWWQFLMGNDCAFYLFVSLAQHFTQSAAYGRDAINICWLNKWMSLAADGEDSWVNS